ncbi:MAG: hypothetical protein H8D56_02275 [Planctomycetes bacterium]|nr:hypothetical protein [Planctomycetota bacterium]MBL7143516.1 hypothetical protein [Phycisphaerae bacterium]
MKKVIAIIILSISVMVPVLARQSDPDYPANHAKVRFAPLHIYLDSGNKSLAAYQFELKAVAGQIKIVGVEGGQHKAFAEAPYYDPAALANDRIIIAAFNTGSELPKGRTRIATIHLQIIGDAEPDYALKLTVAGDAGANEIPAKISFEKGE